MGKIEEKKSSSVYELLLLLFSRGGFINFCKNARGSRVYGLFRCKCPGRARSLGSITRQGMIYARGSALAARKRNYLQVCGVFMQISNSQGATRCTLSRGQIYISTSMPVHATRLVAFAVATLTPPSSRLSTLAKSRSSRCFTALSSIRPGSYAQPINSGRAVDDEDTEAVRGKCYRR